MSRKRICIIGLAYVLLIMLGVGVITTGGQKQETLDEEELVWEIMDISPESIGCDNLSLVTMPGWEQHIYRSADGSRRFVLEVTMPEQLTEKITAADVSHFAQPKEGEAILQWEQGSVQCRAFGTFSQEELEEIVGSIGVDTNE